MKFNKWTMGLAAVGVVSLASAARADEPMEQVHTALSQTTLSGYVDTSAMWNTGSAKWRAPYQPVRRLVMVDNSRPTPPAATW